MFSPKVVWKRGRVVEGSGLENRQGASSREFESHRFRHFQLGLSKPSGLESQSRLMQVQK